MTVFNYREWRVEETDEWVSLVDGLQSDPRIFVIVHDLDSEHGEYVAASASIDEQQAVEIANHLLSWVESLHR